MGPEDVRLPDAMGERLAARAEALLPLGTLLADEHAAVARRARGAGGAGRAPAQHLSLPDPHYAGQMLKPPTAIAWAAYATAMLLNPNNHALDGGPATAEMEKEAVAQIAAMFGYEQHLGHLTASGTIANLEALWVARELHPGAAIVSGANAHYTHARVSAVLGAKHETVPQDADGRIDLDALEARLKRGGVGTVVATPGDHRASARSTTSRAIADLCAEHGARLHVDAAYGGFFRLLADGGEPGVAARAVRRDRARRLDRGRPAQARPAALRLRLRLFADPGVGRLYAHDSPYTYFTSDQLHLGEISLECSRAGAAAAALWTTLRALPLTREGLGPAPRRGARRGARARSAARRRRAHHRSSWRRTSTSSASSPPERRPRTPAPPLTARSTRLRRTAGTSRSCASTPAGCAAATRRSPATPRRPRRCAAACSSRSTRASRASWRPRSQSI